MEPLDFTAVAHEGLAFMNPLSEEDVDEMIEALELEPGAHVLDLGCGKAEVLIRVVERYPGVRAVGLDRSSAVLAEAKRQAEERVPESRVTLLEEDVRDYAPEPGAFDLVISTGGVSSSAAICRACSMTARMLGETPTTSPNARSRSARRR